MSEWTSDSVLRELQPIFQEALETPDVVIDRESNPANTPNWDSFAQITIMEMIESRFGIRFKLTDIEKVKDAGNLSDLIVEKSETR